MARKNRIIEASELDEEDLAPEMPEETVPSLTTEDLEAELADMSTASRARVLKSRQRGRMPARGHAARKTPAAAVQRARQPARDQFEYRPSHTLDAPPPRPGMEQRWVRVKMGGKEDPENLSKARGQGWQPRTLDTVSEEFAPPTMEYGQLGTVIAVRDLMLCERDKRYGQSRRKYMREKHQRQLASGRAKIKNVEQADHPIDIDEPYERPTVGVGRRRAKAQEDLD